MKKLAGLIIFLLIVFSPCGLFAEIAPVSLSQEIASLESLSRTAASPDERYNALISLARLHRLSGNALEAIKALDSALILLPGDGRALLERGRLLISLGEYEKAAESIAVLSAGFSGVGNSAGGNSSVGRSSEGEAPGILLEGRYLSAQLRALHFGSLDALSALAIESAFAGFRSRAYYTLWKLSGEAAWKNRLLGEFPLSPEAKIALNPAFASPTALWLLYPGRESIALEQKAVTTFGPMDTSLKTVTDTSFDTVLQTGLFGREENARALAARLKNAGFESEIRIRLVNGSSFWAVVVPAGNDMNAMITRLKNSGFESFPLS